LLRRRACDWDVFGIGRDEPSRTPERCKPLMGWFLLQESEMSTDKHHKDPDPELPDDLERNPGIGQSKGAFATGEDPEELEGENTAEGNIENDPDVLGRVNANRLGRTNK
jgi:hypothetical protein